MTENTHPNLLLLEIIDKRLEDLESESRNYTTRTGSERLRLIKFLVDQKLLGEFVDIFPSSRVDDIIGWINEYYECK